MRPLFYITFLTILSCNSQSKKFAQTKVDATEIATKTKTDNSRYYTKLDTIIITTEIGDTLKFSQSDFNNIVETHSEFFSEFPENPDMLYYRFVNTVDFGSEVGQDTYYTLYAYFLKQRNGVNKYAAQRQKLLNIYSNINSVFGIFEHGGPYFGHQRRRILGYAEYSICLLPKEENEVEKTYAVTKQKGLYIQSLRQLIEDESKIDFNTLTADKPERNKKLNTIVDELEILISDIFYLRRAQEFHYNNYQYY